jgi:UDP-glucuronate 4-epimerase
METILVTGTAGFIGYHMAIRLLKEGYNVVGLDNINDYYDVELKYGRLSISGIMREEIQWNKPTQSRKYNNYKFYRMRLEDRQQMENLFAENRFDYIVHLAAQAGVRYSLTNPHTYIDSNISGFLNILEGSRHHQPKHLLYASSSSVYGANAHIPFREKDNVDHPVSLYAATKKSNELMAHTYSHLFQIPTSGLRFFTVYGPWGRPDMALFLFTRAIMQGKPIEVFNKGEMMRDFTYIDDVIEGIFRLIKVPASPHAHFDPHNPDPSTSLAPYRVYNIGNSGPVGLTEFIEAIETSLNQKAIKNLLPMQPGDVTRTWADTQKLNKTVDYKPNTPVQDGVEKFIRWYRDFYNL